MRGLALAAMLALAGCAAVSPGAPPDPPPGRDVVFVGEVHDNPAHHETQAEIASRMQPAAIVFEMIPAASELEVNRLRAEAASRAALAGALDWVNSGWPDFAFYAPIMEAAPAARIYGAEVPREETRRAFREGAAAVLPEASRFGLDRPLPADQQATREALQMAAHCDALPAEMLPGMVEAQRLRDAALAAAALRAMEETGGPVLVITGNGHARTDWGAPALLAMAAPDLSIHAMGQGEGPEPGAPYDAFRVADPVERPDPCAAFRQ